jgi:hypothetical protein
VDQTQNLVETFAAQLKAMMDTYMSWSLAMSEDSESIAGNYVQPGSFVVEDTQHLLVVDLFSTSSFFFPSFTQLN